MILTELAYNYDGLIAGTKNLLPLIEKSTKLKIISRVGIGLNSVPLEVCRKKDITVCYTPDAVSMAVVEITIGAILDCTRYITMADRNIRKGNWTRPIGKRIAKSSIGIIGFGRIGSNVLNLLAAFKPQTIYVNDIQNKTKQLKELREKTGITILSVDKETIYKNADIITLHIPLSPAAKALISYKELELMNKNTFLINFSRGGIINEEALYTILKNKKIGGAAIDVFETEPYTGKLKELDNIVLSQHIGSCSFDCREAMETEATADIIRYFKNESLQNEVPEMEYKYQIKS